MEPGSSAMCIMSKLACIMNICYLTLVSFWIVQLSQLEELHLGCLFSFLVVPVTTSS
uniref:Uncharacterized protein n=1 Tax=Rhizophora mucronata TaxID=61149 RepID=A0A2P2NVT4_RHIMU